MAIYRLGRDAIEPLPSTKLSAHGVKERADLQRLLKANISVIADDVLVIAEEFAEWDDSRRRIDLLAVARDGRLVVIELKRDETGGHMELQALRYAAMVSSMTFDRAVEVFADYLEREGDRSSARDRLLEFLGWSEPHEDQFASDVQIVLAAADFSKELTSTVLWLNERDLDVRCVRLQPYEFDGQIILDAQQVIPLPEAEAYQVRVREKAISRREAQRDAGEFTGFWFMNTGEEKASPNRSWDDCKRYGFMLAGGGSRWIEAIRKLRKGDRLFAYLSGYGYVGCGEVIAEAVPQRDFVPPGQSRRLIDLPLKGRPDPDALSDPQRCDWCVGVRWLKAVSRDEAVLKSRSRRPAVERIRQPELVRELCKHLGVELPAIDADMP